MPNHQSNHDPVNTCPPCPNHACKSDKLIYWLGIGLGSGMPKYAAGTWGTLGGLGAVLPLIALGFATFLGITILGLIIGGYVCGRTSKLMGNDDDPHIVWDEWVGMWLTLLPTLFVYHALGKWHDIALSSPKLWFIVGIGFVLFRLFDIIKPFPISFVDRRISGGFGILLDDVLAGVIAGMLLVIGWYSWVGI